MEMAAVSSPVHHWQHADIESQHHDEGQALIGRTVIAGPSHWHMPAVRTVTADRIDQTVTVGQCSLSRFAHTHATEAHVLVLHIPASTPRWHARFPRFLNPWAETENNLDGTL